MNDSLSRAKEASHRAAFNEYGRYVTGGEGAEKAVCHAIETYLAAMGDASTRKDEGLSLKDGAVETSSATPFKTVGGACINPPDTLIDYTGIAHEIWAAAQLVPEEGIEDGAVRVEAVLRREFPSEIPSQTLIGFAEALYTLRRDLRNKRENRTEFGQYLAWEKLSDGEREDWMTIAKYARTASDARSEISGEACKHGWKDSWACPKCGSSLCGRAQADNDIKISYRNKIIAEYEHDILTMAAEISVLKGKLKKRESVARCEVCDWPLADTASKGCVLGNCSYRPEHGSPEWHRIHKRKLDIEDGGSDGNA